MDLCDFDKKSEDITVLIDRKHIKCNDRLHSGEVIKTT